MKFRVLEDCAKIDVRFSCALRRSASQESWESGGINLTRAPGLGFGELGLRGFEYGGVYYTCGKFIQVLLEI